jgi:signal transduction histidine kinase
MQSGSFQTTPPALVPNTLHRLPAAAPTWAPELTTRFHGPLQNLQRAHEAEAWRSESENGRKSGEHARARTVRQIEASHLLSNGLAHDLNNLFQVANTALSLIELRSKLGREVDIPALVEKAELALDRARTVVRRLTLLPVQPHGDVAPVDINSTVATLYGLFALLAGSAIDVRLHLTPSITRVVCNRLDFENALLNIVANSRNAIANGGIIAVGTSLHHRAAVGSAGEACRYVVVTVSDTGQGMTPEIAARAFDPFYSTRTDCGGTGLGLAMVRRFLDEIGGSSTIESSVGIGTSISLSLPVLEHGVASNGFATPDR